MSNKYDIIISKGFLLGLVILLLNDLILKDAYPNFITGKLSDFSGLFIFPMFFSAFFPNKKSAIYVLTFISFIIWKLPVSDSLIEIWNNLKIYNINRVTDYSDYVALFILPISYTYKLAEFKFPKKKLAVNVICALSVFAFCSTAGTHGSLKGYRYPVSKETLEAAITAVIDEEKSLNRPKHDSINEDYYNTDGYITLYINAPEEYNYTFRFYGGEEEWKNSPNSSEIFICYAYDNLGNGGSEGAGGVEWYRFGLKDRLINYFEANFVSKVDKKLGVKHEDEK